MQNPSLKYSLFGAVSIIFVFLSAYLVQKTYFLHPVVQWGSLIIYLFFMDLASRKDCAANGYERDFREMTRTPFTVFLLINLGYWLFYYGIHLYDPQLTVMELDGQIAMLQAQIQAGTGDPVTANDIRQQLIELEKIKQHPVTPLGPILTRMAVGALGGFGLAAGITAIRRMA
jgi:hypothetical protein